MQPHLGDDFDTEVVQGLIKEYGDVLKVSRSRFCLISLPMLREYISNYNYIVDKYIQHIREEARGQGLERHAVLHSLINHQRDRLLVGDSKDSTAYSDEIKNIIKKGVVEGEVPQEDVVEFNTELANKILNSPLDVDPTEITKGAASEVRKILLSSFEKFAKWTFELLTGSPFQTMDFHDIIFDVTQKVVEGEIDRLIICIPPRHSKTQIMSISLPLYSYCHNASSQNIITSYNEDIVFDSSGKVRQTMLDPLFQMIFPGVTVDPKKTQLKMWGTTRAGTFHAIPSGGGLTGKGAGSLSEKYSGCFIVDDPIKPTNAYSDLVREEINDRFNNTFLSRLANDGEILVNGERKECARTPMIIIMQRLHENDLVGYLLKGGSTDKYHYLNIPSIITEGVGSKEYYDDLIERFGFTHAIPILYNLDRGEDETALWPARKQLETLKILKKTHPYTFFSQYEGEPIARGVGLINESWFCTYDPLRFDYNTISTSFVTADTASTEKTYSDYTVIIHWGLQRQTNNLIALDMLVGKFNTPTLIKKVREFWIKLNKIDQHNYISGLLPTALYMENKSSGLYLNQQFMEDGTVTVYPVERDANSGNKITRFLNAVPYFAQMRIWFPEGHEHLGHIKREILSVTSLGSGTGNDDVIDNISDACTVAFSKPSIDYVGIYGGNSSYE